MAKRILLIGGNFLPELTGIGKYNGEMIRWFARNGYDCTVISTAPYYPQWEVQKPYSNLWFQREEIQTEGKTIEVYRCPHYVPTIPNGTRRLLSEISFGASAFFALLRVLAKKRFHFVLTVAPPFQLGYHALLYKLFRKAKFLYHIQDMQIEAARDLNMIRSKGLIRLLFKLEKRILNRSDLISSISQGMLKKIGAKAQREVVFFPNWVDTEMFFPLHGKEGLKMRFGFHPADKVVLYSGAIGEKQGLEMILETAQTLQQKEELKFVICGTGPYKEELERQALQKGLKNVRFLPLQEREDFNAFLNMADVHLVIQKANAGDLVMPSKLTTILAVGGLALITAAKGSSLYQNVASHKMGKLVEPENSLKFTVALLECIQQDFSQEKQNALQYAVQMLSIDSVLTRYANEMEGLYGDQLRGRKPKKVILKESNKEFALQTVAS